MNMAIKISLVFMFVFLLIEGFAQEKIDRSKEEINKGSRTGQHREKHSHSSYGYSDNDQTFQNMLFVGIAEGFLFITYYSTIGNYELEDHLHNKLTTYPFYNGLSGNYKNSNSGLLSGKLFRVDLGNSFLYSNESLFGNHLKFKLRPFQYFFMQVDYFQLVEYDKIYKEYSNLSLFNFNVCYDRLRFEKFNLGWNLGANYIGNEVKKAGFSYGLNTEIFIVKNFSLLSSMKWSMINEASVNEFELLGKYHINRYFVSFGYEHLKIATPTYDFISFGGGIYF